MKSLLLSTLLALSSALTPLSEARAQTNAPGNTQSQGYEARQAFTGRSFLKDNNIWIYSQTFADTFGMPKLNIAPLQGFEAAAFRIEDAGYKLCGMGGKEENCKSTEYCILDVYFDEKKTPLPWATDQRSDFFAIYSSLRYLANGNEDPVGSPLPPGVRGNGAAIYGMHAFADFATKQEAIWLENSQVEGNTDADGNYNLLGVHAYKRGAVAGLTMISFSYGCSGSVRREVTIRLEVRDLIKTPNLKRLHQLVIPEMFVSRIDLALKEKNARDTAFYRSLFFKP